MISEMDETFAEANVRRAIELHQPELEQAIKRCLDRHVESASAGISIVCGLWLAKNLRITFGKTLPKFYAHAGVEGPHLYDDDDCLAKNARYKASPCAQTGLDTRVMQQQQYHWLAVWGDFYPQGGAILRRIGSVEFVVATSGLVTSDEDHDVSVEVWKLVTDFACRSNREDFRRANLPGSDPRHLNYLRNEWPRMAASHPTGGGDSPYPEEHRRIQESGPPAGTR